MKKYIQSQNGNKKNDDDLIKLVESPEEAIDLATSCKLFSRNTNLS